MSLLAKFRWFLAPSIFQAAISFATLPLATLVLGPEDYGAYALVATIVGLASAVACLGSSYLLAQVFSEGDEKKIRQVVSKQSLISLVLAAVLTLVLMFAWSGVIAWFPNFLSIPRTGFILSMVAIVPSTIWAIALDVLTLDGRAKLFAKIVIGQSLFSVTILFACLFWLHLGPLSLFISAFAAALVLGAGATVSLRRYWEYPSLASDELSLFRNSVSLTGANFIEVFYQPLERNLLAVSSGLTSLGLYAHAQQYRTIVGVATKALARSIWPATLEEAREPELTFPRTNRYWRLTYFGLAILGLSFAAVGDEFIGLLTHGKFIGAGPFSAASIAYLLVQNSGKAHTGYMYAHGEVGPYARFSIIAAVWGMVCALLAIPAWGVWGALLAIFMQQIVLRVAIQSHVARTVRVASHDAWVLAGTAGIAVVVALDVYMEASMLTRTGCAVLIGACLLGAYLFPTKVRGTRV